MAISSATISGSGFSLVGGSLPATLNPNQSLTLQVQFSPMATGGASGQLTISSDSATNNTTTVLLSGSGAVTQLPQLTLSTGALSFGSVTVNTSTTQTLTLTSTGTSPVTISLATISETGFSLVGGSLPTTLNPNQSLTLQIQFSPMATGVASGQLKISSNSATGSTAVVALSGTSTAIPNPQLTVSAGSLSFGNVAVNTASTQNVTLTSTGNTPVTVSSATTSGAGFTIVAQSFPMTLNPNQSLTLQIQFSPTSTGSASGQMTISSNSTSNSMVVVALSGKGIAANPQLMIGVTSLDFGSVAANTPVTKTRVLTSTGTSPVVVSSVTVSGTGFSLIGGSFPITLNPMQTVTLQIQFLPTGVGTQTGQVTIVSSSTTGETSILILSGAGTGGTHGVDLAWDAPTSSPSPVAGYNVYRSTGSSGSFVLTSSSPVMGVAYVDTGVVSGTSYKYVVKSVDGNGVESGASNQVTVMVP